MSGVSAGFCLGTVATAYRDRLMVGAKKNHKRVTYAIFWTRFSNSAFASIASSYVS
jgi:hypothetical protein